MRTLAVMLLVFGLFAGTAAAFVVTVGLKIVRSPLGGTRLPAAFGPACDCPQERAAIRFRLREPDRIDVEIVDEDEEVVATLLADEARAPGAVRLAWDGRDDRGAVVAEGEYRLRVRLHEEGRTILVPHAVEVDTTRPEVGIASVSPRTVSPDGDGRRDEVEVAYVASERAAALVLVDGVVAHESRVRPSGRARVRWEGTRDSEPLPAGSYELSLAVRDRTGNVSAPTDPVPITVRYLELRSTSLVVRRGGPLRFQVDTDLERFSWRLRRRGGGGPIIVAESVEPSVSSRLPRTVRPGRYVLVVAADGHRDRAAVRVVRRRR